MSDSILIVDDSLSFTRKLTKAFAQVSDKKILKAFSLKETRDVIRKGTDGIFLAICNAELPDAEHGEVIDLLCNEGVPVIVLTKTINEHMREQMLSKSIVEYFFKSELADFDIENILETYKRLISNHNKKLMIVDDSTIMRHLLSNLLQRRHYTIVQASNGAEALQRLIEHPDIKLVITDYNMPEMDGFQLITKLRLLHGKDRLSIVALSANTDPSLSARLLKTGANDFINKDFTPEEFFARITQNLEMLQLIEETRDAANRDYLTKLYNRRYFFNEAPDFVHDNQKPVIGLAMLDIDFFKKINDSFGHDAGDEALRVMARALREYFDENALVARFGGEEFCILLQAKSDKQVFEKLDLFRIMLSKEVVSMPNQAFNMTVSIGYTLLNPTEKIDDAVTRADDALYQSKSTGRNKVSPQPEADTDSAIST